MQNLASWCCMYTCNKMVFEDKINIQLRGQITVCPHMPKCIPPSMHIFIEMPWTPFKWQTLVFINVWAIQFISYFFFFENKNKNVFIALNQYADFHVVYMYCTLAFAYRHLTLYNLYTFFCIHFVYPDYKLYIYMWNDSF